MAKYSVSIPIAGSCTVEVEAESEAGAVEAAWAVVDDEQARHLEWEFFSSLVDGNVLHASQNTIEVYREDDGDGA